MKVFRLICSLVAAASLASAARAASPASITLVPDRSCYKVGDPVTVSIIKGDSSPAVVVGGQFFLSFDASKLAYQHAAVGDAPFSTLIYDVPSGNNLSVAVGVAGGGPGTFAPGAIARLVFTATHEICSAGGLVTFRVSVPPTTLTDSLGHSVASTTSDLGAMSIDSTAPVISCPPPTTVYADAGGCTASFSGSLQLFGDAQFQASPGPGSQTVPHVFSDLCCYGGIAYVPTAPLRLNQITELSASLLGLAGQHFGCGSPRLVIFLDDNRDLTALFGTPALGYSDPSPTVWTPSGNLVNLGVWDLSHIGGGGYNASFSQAVTLAGSHYVAEIDIIMDDGCGPNPLDLYFNNLSINNTAHSLNPGLTPYAATVSDSCDQSPSLVGVRSDAQSLAAPYPSGTTTITWTATDCAGNQSTCQSTVTVNGLSTLNATVALTGAGPGPFTRCITFDLQNGSGACPAPAASISAVMTFTGGVASAAIPIPCGPYTCISARDALHTLRRTADAGHFGISGGSYSATFTGTDALIGGNLNDDAYIDILDFGVYVGQYGHSYPAGETCATAFPNADIAGDGGPVGLQDFSFIQVNFLKFRDIDCCSNGLFAPPNTPGGPTTDISVAELVARGLWNSAKADRNLDGRVNSADVAMVLSRGLPRSVSDFNGDGAIGVQDITEFLSAWFMKHPRADIDNDGAVTVQDLFSFLGAWFDRR